MRRAKKRSMTRIRFHCTGCQFPITNLVRLLTDRGLLSDADETDYIPRGLYTATGPPDPYEGFVVNVADAAYSRQPDQEGYGCCGFSPGTVMNRLCPEGHAYGWELSDCWTGGRGVWLAFDRVVLSDGDGRPFPTTAVSPDWAEANDRTAYHVARGIDNTGSFGDLPVLADALEEGGCADRVILDHLRNPGTHRGGCWFVDQILGKV